MELFRDGGEKFKKIKAAVKPYGIEVGWWLTTSVNSGPNPDFQRLIKPDGSKAPYSNCALCPNLRKRISESVALFAEIGKPDFIFFEDDFSICAQTEKMGCFCDAHLKEFSKREGRNYTREELVSILNERTPEALAINRRWRELIKDSLVGFAAAIRAELDKKSPEISIGHMQPGFSDMEGDSTEAVARAFAGSNHVPYVRYFSCFYGIENANDIPASLFNPLYKIQHTGDGMLFYHESDMWPHSRYFRSASFGKACLGAVYSLGYDGSTFNNTTFVDNQNSEKGYTRMFAAEHKRFEEVHRIAKQCKISGVQLEYDPFYATIYGENSSWLYGLAQFGIPYTTAGGKVAFWDERQAKYMDDESIMKALSGGLFLEGGAAKVLCDRGYSKYLGVTVGEPMCKKPFFRTFSPDAEPMSFDLSMREVICDEFASKEIGKTMGGPYGYSPTGTCDLMKLTVDDPKCEIITNIYGFQKNHVAIGMVHYENSLGGRVVTLPMTLDNKYKVINARRRRLIQDQLLWCGGDVPFVKDTPSVYVIMNEAIDSEKSGFKGMLTLVNFCEDTADEVKLHMPEKWSSNVQICTLEQNGEWRELKYEMKDNELCINERLEYLSPMYLLIK